MRLARDHHGARVAEPIVSSGACSMNLCGLQENRVRPDSGEVRDATDGSDHPGHFLLVWSQRSKSFKSWTTTVFTSPALCLMSLKAQKS